MIGRTWQLWGQASHDTHWHVGEWWWVKLHGQALPLVPLLVEEWTGDPRAPEVTHYGWEYVDKPHVVVMIYPRAASPRMSPWLLELCFTYGMKVEIDRGKGKMLALRITARVPTPDEAASSNAS